MSSDIGLLIILMRDRIGDRDIDTAEIRGLVFEFVFLVLGIVGLSVRVCLP